MISQQAQKIMTSEPTKTKRKIFATLAVAMMMGFCNALGIPYGRGSEKKDKEAPIGRMREPKEND